MGEARLRIRDIFERTGGTIDGEVRNLHAPWRLTSAPRLPQLWRIHLGPRLSVVGCRRPSGRLAASCFHAPQLTWQIWNARQERELLVEALANSDKLLAVYPQLDPEKQEMRIDGARVREVSSRCLWAICP